MQQLTAAKILAFPSSQRAAVEQLIEKCIPSSEAPLEPEEAGLTGGWRQDGRTHLPRKGGGWSRLRCPPRSPAPPGPARPRRHGPVGRRPRGRRRGCRRLTALRHPPRCRPRPRALQLRASRSAPRPPPGPHPPPTRTAARRAQPWFRGGSSSAGQHRTSPQDTSDHRSTWG